MPINLRDFFRDAFAPTAKLGSYGALFATELRDGDDITSKANLAGKAHGKKRTIDEVVTADKVCGFAERDWLSVLTSSWDKLGGNSSNHAKGSTLRTKEPVLRKTQITFSMTEYAGAVKVSLGGLFLRSHDLMTAST
jgi:hypothetical protein